MDSNTHINRIQIPQGFELNPIQGKALEYLEEELRTPSVPSGLMGIANRILGLVKKAGSTLSEGGEKAVTALGFIGTTFKALGTIKSIKALVDLAKESKGIPESAKHKHNLQVASSTMGVALGTLSGINLFDTVGVLTLSNISSSLGLVLFPFSSFVGVLEIAKSSIDIAVSSYKIKDFDQKMEKIKGKKIEWKQEIGLSFVEKIIKKSQGKIEILDKGLVEKEMLVESTGKQLQDLIDEFKQHPHNKSELRAKASEYYAACDDFDRTYDKKIVKQEKVRRWEKINLAIQEKKILSSDAKLESFKQEKLNKLKVKKWNLNLDKIKEGLTVAQAVAMIVLTIASIILLATGVGAVPALVTMASIGLLLSISSVGLNIFKKYKKPKPTFSVTVPDFSES